MEIEDLLEASSATEAFKVAVRAYANYADEPAIAMTRHAPRVKVQRLLCQLLAAEPGLEVESVVVDATSGCSDFRGTLRVQAVGQSKVFDFVWDCQWRAREEGWVDYFGFPDQIRAAREFGWRCFARWEGQDVAPADLLLDAESAGTAQLA
jgi:hypothetical protein